MTVAALYVETNGVYYGLPDVDPWDEARDARLYEGPWPVVAHPPCARWSRLAGFTEARFGLMRGEDGGCFAAALTSVQRFGGVLEHPAYSKAWDAYGLSEPTWRGGWTAGLDGGWTAYVEQGRYGLPVKKATWLYAVGVELPELRWGYTPDAAGDPANQDDWGGMHAWRDRFGKRREQWLPGTHRGTHKGLSATSPPAFRDVLLDMARSASKVGAVKPHRIELQPPRHGSEHKESSGLVAAQEANEARKGKPDSVDAPPLRTFKGSKPQQIDGQLGFDDLHRLDGCA